MPSPAMKSPSGTQLSLLNEPRGGRTSASNARLSLNVLTRLLECSQGITDQTAVYLKAIFPVVVQAAEEAQGLPVSKTTLCPALLNPLAAITKRPPTRPDEFLQMETLLDFVNRRLGNATEKARLEEQINALLKGDSAELLITQEGIASPLYATDRGEATRIFTPLLMSNAAEAAEALVEAFVLLRANQADVHTGIAKLFWRQNTSTAEVLHLVEGCADGQARAFFRNLLAQPEQRQREIFSTINLETFYAAFGGEQN